MTSASSSEVTAGMRVSSSTSELRQIEELVWELPATGKMRVPARVFADRELLDAIAGGASLAQLVNVAALPGVFETVLAMPDVHQGYGFPVGGVAAMELPDGVVSPGGVGYDINCGVRLLALPLSEAELGDRREALVHKISRTVPAGAGKESRTFTKAADLDRLLLEGSRVLGSDDDVMRTESGGCLPGADPSAVSPRAKERGRGQIGTMGSGNHFVEVQEVDEILDEDAARAFGLREQQVTVLIHSGSRGLGHQVCTDYVKAMDGAMRRYGIELEDRQLACAPASSPEGQSYLAAMAAAANFAWSNRQGIADAVRSAVSRILGADVARGTRQVYDVAHNVAKTEEYARPSSACAPQGRHESVPSWCGGYPRRLQRRRSAGLHPREHGDGQLRARRRAGFDGEGVRHHVPRRRAHSFADGCPEADRRARAATRARGARHRRPLPFAQRPCRGGALRLQGRRASGARRRAGRARPSRRPPRAARGGQGLRKLNARRSARSTAAATRYVAVQCAVRTRYARSAALPVRRYAPS